MQEISKIQDEYEKKREQNHHKMVETIQHKIQDDEVVRKSAETIVETVETEKKKAEKDSIEGVFVTIFVDFLARYQRFLWRMEMKIQH